MQRRPVDVAVVADLHLGTYACRAREFLSYLKSIQPRVLVLNGDILDAWQLSRHYFPTAHIQVIQELCSLLSTGTRVIYVTGNHDEMLRRYSDLQLGNFQLTDKVLIEVNGQVTWIFHGDVFDHTSAGPAKFWAKLGSNGYAVLLGFNRMVNNLLHFFGRNKISLSHQLMQQSNKRFLKIENFERKIAEVAIEKKYGVVICGHIHQPQKRVIETDEGSVIYLNSGDWVDHMTSLEYFDNQWNLHEHKPDAAIKVHPMFPKPEPEVVTDHITIYLHSLEPKRSVL